MAENLIRNGEKVLEIPAANVRSSLESLSRLESSASQVVHRLESVKTVLEEDTAHNQTPTAPTYYFHPEKKLPSEILTNLETLIAQPIDDVDEISEYPLPPIDEISHLILVSHSITSYLSYLNRRQLHKVTSKILADTNRWLSQMFRFPDCSASYHRDSSECLVRAIRLAITAKFPGYFESGIGSLPEVGIYISDNSSNLILQFACRQIGLPMNCIRIIQCNTIEGGVGTIDISALQRAINLDVNANRVPLLLIANAGASLLGETDNLARLQEICRANHIWLHCRGHNLVSLVLVQGTSQTEPVADSMTLNLSNWFGIPGVSTVLLYRSIPNVAPSILFDSDPLLSRYLSAISVWMLLQALGREAISDRIINAFQTCRIFYDIVSKVDGLQILSNPPGSGAQIADLANKPLNVTVLFETAVPVVVFKFKPDPSLIESIECTDSVVSQNEELASVDNSNHTDAKQSYEIQASYYDRLNSWLGQILQRDSSQIDLEIIDHAKHGTCIRFCPLELGVAELPPSEEYLESFAVCLPAQVEILRATTKHKRTFNKLVKDSAVLQLVELSDWAGLGGVRYVPEFFDLLTDQSKTELNKLNQNLVDHLKTTDSAFSLGEGEDGLTCVRFGMVTEDTDVNELLELVIDAGQIIQEDSKVLDSMSEIVRKGIEEAELEIQKENEEKLWQEGILRHVPVVGHFVNWFSPPAKETGIKGRTLNLNQGTVESTENIYKYHMQLPSGTHQLPSSQPQTSHSRTESSSSGVNVQQQSTGAAQQTNESKESPKPDNKTMEEDVIEPTELTNGTENSTK